MFDNKFSAKKVLITALFFCAVLAFGTDFFAGVRVQANSLKTSSADMFATLSLTIGVSKTGFATFNTTADTLNGKQICPTTTTAGCDFSQSDNIVRTNDAVEYVYQYSVNAGSEDVTITAVAPTGTVWSVLPAFCSAGSSISADSKTIICKRGVQTEGTSESLPFIARVLGTTANATTLTASGSVAGPSSTTVTASNNQVTVTAAPRFNLRKTYQSYEPYTLSGVSGYRIYYRAYIEVYDNSSPAALNPWYGSETLASPITFTDVVSGISPNARVQSCNVQSDNGGSAGAITCTQNAAGQDISVSIAGANTSLSQYSTPPTDSRYIVGTYRVYIFIPASDITGAPNQSLSTTNTYTNFDPNSTSNQSNFGTVNENTSDNTVTRAFTPITAASFSKAFVKDYNDGNATFGFSSGGNTLVNPGSIFASQVSISNPTTSNLTNVQLCDVFDNSVYSVIETAPGSGIVYGFTGVTPTQVQFATGYVNPNWKPTVTGGNPTGMRTECSDPSVQWYSSPTAVPGGLQAITKFRVTYATLAPNATGTVRVRLQARDRYFGTSTVIPTNTVLPNYALWRSNEQFSTYTDNTYYQGTYPGTASGSVGARLILSRAVVRITKETEQNNTVNAVETGKEVGFVLNPTISSTGDLTPTQVTVTDVLPVGLTYVVGSAQQNGVMLRPQIIVCTGAGAPDARCTASGQQILIWKFENVVPNQPFAPISFRTLASLSVSNGQILTNTAIISSPAGASAEIDRTSTRSVTVTTPSTFIIAKDTSTPQIEIGDNFRYTVSYRNASVTQDYTGLDFIDVLPYNGDAILDFGNDTHIRDPRTNYAGTRTLTSVSATTTSAVWYFTNVSPASIDTSPKDASNANPGTGGSIWCAGTAAGPDASCGFTMAQVTAVRMRDNVTMPRGNSVRSFTLNFSSSGNAAENIYTNNSTGAVNELTLAVSSNNVSVVVVDSIIRGIVWDDKNGDGIQTADETARFANLLVYLQGTDSDGVMVTRETYTDANGAYAFTGLKSGTYTVTFSKPDAGTNNYSVSPQLQGTDTSIDSDGSVTTLRTNSITLAINEDRNNIDQGFFTTPLASHVTLSGRVLGSNGRGIAKAFVTMTDINGAMRYAMTNQFGFYRFADVPAGTTVVISASAKRLRFVQNNMLVNVTEDDMQLNFTAAPGK